MRRIFLTINVNCEDEYFQKLDEIVKLNIGEILKSKKLSFKPGELEIVRGKIIAETILENKGDLLLGYAIQEKGQLKKIIQLIEDKKVTISKIFYDGGNRKKDAIKKYKEKYKLHSNWMDYSPEFVELQYDKFEKKIMNIKIEAKENSVEIEAI